MVCGHRGADVRTLFEGQHRLAELKKSDPVKIARNGLFKLGVILRRIAPMAKAREDHHP
jgi:hypothetical protein